VVKSKREKQKVLNYERDEFEGEMKAVFEIAL